LRNCWLRVAASTREPRRVSAAIIFVQSAQKPWAEEGTRFFNRQLGMEAGRACPVMHGRSATTSIRKSHHAGLSRTAKNSSISSPTDVVWGRAIDVRTSRHVFKYDIPDRPRTALRSTASGRNGRAGANPDGRVGTSLRAPEQGERRSWTAIPRGYHQQAGVRGNKAVARTSEASFRPSGPKKSAGQGPARTKFARTLFGRRRQSAKEKAL